MNVEQIFQQVMDENCPDPLHRFAELVAADAVEKERELNQELLEALKLLRTEAGEGDLAAWFIKEVADDLIAKAEEQA